MKKILCMLGLLAWSLQACNRTYLNPSTAAQDQVITSSDGLINTSNGLQARYTGSGQLGVVYTSQAIGGLSTGEFVVLNQGNTEELALSNGVGAVAPQNSVTTNLWNQANLIKANAGLVLANVQNAPDPGTRSGLVAHASIFQALSIFWITQFFEQMPLEVRTNAPFVDRATALRAAITQLQTAATQLAATPASADFNAKIAPGIDLANTIQALIARLSLEVGDNDAAIAAAARVSLASRSVFSFLDVTPNPISFSIFGNRNVYEPANVSLGLPAALAPESGDARIPFLVRANPTPTQNRGLSFYTALAAPIPVYVPGEMLLIQAEANARRNNLTEAVRFLNLVRTSTTTVPAPTGTAPFPTTMPGANLPAYSGPQTQAAILTEIYRQRCIELAFQGFRLGDNRRFGRPGPGQLGAPTPNGPAERNRNFYPYPLQERINNNQTPPNPAG